LVRKSNQYASLTLDLHSFPKTFAHIWSSWNLIFVVLPLNCDFNFNLSMKFNSSFFVQRDYCLLKYQQYGFFTIRFWKILHMNDWTMFLYLFSDFLKIFIRRILNENKLKFCSQKNLVNAQYFFNHFLNFFCPFKGILGDTPIFNINFYLLLEVG
jgi:hypothetical protein